MLLGNDIFQRMSLYEGILASNTVEIFLTDIYL